MPTSCRVIPGISLCDVVPEVAKSCDDKNLNVETWARPMASVDRVIRTLGPGVSVT